MEPYAALTVGFCLNWELGAEREREEREEREREREEVNSFCA